VRLNSQLIKWNSYQSSVPKYKFLPQHSKHTICKRQPRDYCQLLTDSTQYISQRIHLIDERRYTLKLFGLMTYNLENNTGVLTTYCETEVGLQSLCDNKKNIQPSQASLCITVKVHSANSNIGVTVMRCSFCETHFPRSPILSQIPESYFCINFWELLEHDFITGQVSCLQWLGKI